MPPLIEPRVLKGFRDFLPEAELERGRVQRVLEGVFEGFGFVPIDTPALEYAEVLLGKGGGETDKQMYRFADNGGRDVALRFDLTVPFARYIAAHRSKLYLPFKRYHMAKVWRGENTQRGRYREFVQCDFDIVGTDCASADFEILLLMRDSMRALGVGGVRIHLSHRGVFNRLLGHLGLQSRAVEVLRIVDKLKKVGVDETRTALGEAVGGPAAAAVMDFISPEPDFAATVTKMERLAGGEDEDTVRLRDIRALMGELAVEADYTLDPSITRGLDYYTGIVYETFLDKLPGIGSVCSGGRYNDLASLYTTERLPGVGSSIGLDRLLSALEELGATPERRSAVEVLVLCVDQSLLATYHSIARGLRAAGIAAEVYPEGKKLPLQFSYAEKKGIRFGILFGPEERAAGGLTLRDLERRKSHEGIPIEKAPAEVAAFLGRNGAEEGRG